MLKRVIFIFDGMYLVLRMRNCRHQVQVGIRPDFLEEERQKKNRFSTDFLQTIDEEKVFPSSLSILILISLDYRIPYPS